MTALIPAVGVEHEVGNATRRTVMAVSPAARPDPRRRLAGRGAAVGQHPPRTREVAGVAVRVALQVVLVLRLGLPERTRRSDLGDDLAGPQPGRLDVGDGVLGDPALLLIEVEDRRAVARAEVVPLAVQRRRVVDLEEELEQLPIGGHFGVEGDLDRLGVGPVVPVGGVGDLASGVAHPRREHPWTLSDQVLHPPETPSGQDRLLPLLTHRFAPGGGWLLQQLTLRHLHAFPDPGLSDPTGATGRPRCDDDARNRTPAGPGAEELRSWTARLCRWPWLPAAPRRS